MNYLAVLTAISTLTIRIPAYLFLRWIPGDHGVLTTLPAFVVYLACLLLLRRSPRNHSEATKHTPAGNRRREDVGDLITSENGFLQRLGIVLFGLPDSRNPTLTSVTIGINVLLACSVIDFIIRAPLLYPSDDLRFSRVGYVSPVSAKILIREPFPPTDALELTYTATSSSSSHSDKVLVGNFTDATDFSQAVTLDNLVPDTRYQYHVSNNLSGTFSTSPAPGSPEGQQLSFVTSSCIKAGWPYPQKHPLALPGFSYLAKVLQELSSPASFMLFLGDFIYVDVPIRVGKTASHYRSEYRRVYASPSWSESPALKTLPWIHTLDDHEIENDWAQGNTTDPFPAASDAFWHYHVSVNPPIPKDTTPDNTTYFEFTEGPASFFMADTRRYRTHPEPYPNATIMGQRQLQDLLLFIGRPEPEHVKWKIIAFSVPFTQNWRVGTKDTWGGFLIEREIVLKAMHKAEAELGVRIIILSGDRHEFGSVRYPSVGATANASGPHEFSVGPLSQFYLPSPTFKQIDNDIVLAYYPFGNSKLGSIDIVPARGGEPKVKSILKYTLFIDGEVAWEYTLSSPSPEYVSSR